MPRRSLPNPFCGRRARAGMTLIDLAITVSIVGILVAVTTPVFVDSLNKQRAESAAERVRADLEMIRTAAISRSQSYSVIFDVAGDSYTAPGLADMDRPDAAYAISLGADPYSAELVSADFNAAATVRFNHYGQPDNGGVITVRAGASQQTVTLDGTTGRASIP